MPRREGEDNKKGIRVVLFNVEIKKSSLSLKPRRLKENLTSENLLETKSQSMILRLSQKQQTTFSRFFIARPQAITN